MRYIEVFTTTVSEVGSSTQISGCLASYFEGAHVSFDLDDIDRVLRVASPAPIDALLIIQMLSVFGFQADVMPDEIIAIDLRS